MDDQGFCKIVGRSKDMIIRGGENIYPAELEDFFHTHPQVQEVQVRHPAQVSPQEQEPGMGMATSNIWLWLGKVVGVKDDRMGEEICACIRLKKGEKTTEEEIKAFCKGKVGASTRPKLMLLCSSTLSPCQPASPWSHCPSLQLHPISLNL